MTSPTTSTRALRIVAAFGIKTRRRLRSLRLLDLLPVLGVPGVQFVSLQYMESAAEIREVRAAHGMQVHHWQEAIDDYDETAALVCALGAEHLGIVLDETTRKRVVRAIATAVSPAESPHHSPAAPRPRPKPRPSATGRPMP